MYKLTSTESILRISDDASIPPDTANRDYADYLSWLEQGNTPEPYTTPTPEVPERIEALQDLLVLDSAGLGPAYEAWALSPDRTFAQKAFINKATHWKRTDPTLLAATTALGLTSAQVDAFFIDGATR